MALLKFVLMAAAASGAAALRSMSTICTSEPPIYVEAGTPISARISNPWNETCEAVLRFYDPAYLPVTWSFAPITCSGQEIAEFTVPKAAPSGDADVTWRCSGNFSPTCSHVIIRNGLGNMDSVSTMQVGRVGCVLASRQTVTTLVTQTDTRTTVVQTLSPVLTLETTSFLSPRSPLGTEEHPANSTDSMSARASFNADSTTGLPGSSTNVAAASSDQRSIDVTNLPSSSNAPLNADMATVLASASVMLTTNTAAAPATSVVTVTVTSCPTATSSQMSQSG